MSRHILVGFIVMLLLFPSVVQAEEFPILDLQVDIRQAHCYWLTETQRISMQAVIGYLDEISNETDSLDGLLSDFINQSSLISSLTTHVALNNALRQLQDITTDFRTETRRILTSHPGKGLTLLNRIQTALTENDAYLDGLFDTYWSLRTTNELLIFDTRVDHAQDILDILSVRGYNISEAQEKLDEITQKRSDLASAYQSRDRDEIHETNREIYELSSELRTIVHDLQVVIPEGRRVHFWIRIGERAVNRTEAIISELEKLGLTISSLEQIHAQISSDLSDATTAYDSGDMDSAKNALREVRQGFVDLRDAYHELLQTESLSQEMNTVIQSTITALDDAAEEMQESLE